MKSPSNMRELVCVATFTKELPSEAKEENK